MLYICTMTNASTSSLLNELTALTVKVLQSRKKSGPTLNIFHELINYASRINCLQVTITPWFLRSIHLIIDCDLRR